MYVRVFYFATDHLEQENLVLKKTRDWESEVIRTIAA